MIGEFRWKRTRYNLFISKWGIAIILEAGYKILSETKRPVQTEIIQIADNLYFYPSLQPWPESEQLVAEEVLCFCKGLEFVRSNISRAVENHPCLITLRSIHFSACNMQNEALTACAIQWASEAFDFSMPEIKAVFDNTQLPCGKYIYDFSALVQN
ncbi:MAG: hypothetical protein OSJ73_17300 [Lachnospiraceae bacterium]|jgi:hypothetical protein|nr:hypothetical protein [Lachnospiraceae bacterium]